MQNRGLTPTVVENAIKHGENQVGKVPGTTAHYDPINNITVITNTSTGNVVTTSLGRIRQ
ncbi:MAG: hypothetical protein HQK53_13290 [Oligoflexia bacterium]|nr:hypothetical protein [Oligoflexia bacterium]